MPTSPRELDDVIGRVRGATCVVLFLDYDGTLVPFAPIPDLASPDTDLLALLRALASRDGTDVHIVSGRSRHTLEEWLGDLPLGLHAEHGAWSRPRGAPRWRLIDVAAPRWRAAVLALLREATARAPGSLIEEKTLGLAWHYRMADADDGPARAQELAGRIATLAVDDPLEILYGDKVIEVRPPFVNKGCVVGPILATKPPDVLALALGDDRTDQDLFGALPATGIAVHVGDRPSAATVRVHDVPAARALLRALLG